MSDESAAGPKTEITEQRHERLAASLEQQFHACRRETDIWLERNRTEEGYFYHDKLDGLIKLVRVNAQLAGVIARLGNAKNRNSKTQ